MAPKPEARFRQLVMKKLRDANVFAWAIETGETGRGIPDIYMVQNGKPTWVELKAMPAVRMESERKVPFRPLQHSWLARNDAEGGLSVVGVRYADGYVFAHISAVDKETGRILKASALEQKKFDVGGLLAWMGSLK